MTDRPLHIAFLWHMHQPSYKDPFSNRFVLPWVRLHGVKDYLDTLLILHEYPQIKQTFNVVPSLLDQLNDYIYNGAQDRHLELTLRQPSSLTEAEKIFILEYFFLANWDTMVKPYPRFYELLIKRGMIYSKADLARITRYFSDQDFLDLQVLFNLAWIDPMFRQADAFLKALVDKQRDYTEEEKSLLITKQFDILRRIIPEYRSLASSGQIEISVSPFYHPILPLLWDTDSARVAMPHAKMPKKRFAHPEDALEQIRRGTAFFEETFGFRPVGMWPSEGSVSEEVVSAIGEQGLKWIATDEEVLARSLERGFRGPDGLVIDGPSLYRPYTYSGVNLFFRDHKLSDEIGFVYSGWQAERAVDDFISKLSAIRDSLPGDRPHCVPVILDGENAWEYYKNDGQDFLHALYKALSNDNRFKTTTMSDYLAEFGPGEPLKKLHPGSWIGADFHVWIGHDEDNMAWDYLSQTRDDLEEHAKEYPDADLSEAWKSIYMAEGSDWNWWYGDEHTTDNAKEFDELFRGYLMHVYNVIDREIPPNIFVPVLMEDRRIVPDSEMKGFIYPKIDGRMTSYFEWYNGGHIDAKRGGGSMHKADSVVSDLYYGFNKDNLYLRIDPSIPFSEMEERIVLCVDIFIPSAHRIVIDPFANMASVCCLEDKRWNAIEGDIETETDEVCEIAIPFTAVSAKEGDELHFAVEVIKSDHIPACGDKDLSFSDKVVERCPLRGHVRITVPSADFDRMMWY